MLGLPDGIGACLFDLDGVLTRTAAVHAVAWKQMFDEYLAERSERTDEPCRLFDIDADYNEHVDGKPRFDGVRSFLRSRDIELPEGRADDPPDQETIAGLGNRKNVLVIELIRREGAPVYDGSVRYVHATREAGLARAVVSSSANCREVLRSAGLLELFDGVIDGVVIERDGLQGKPAPDAFLAGARLVGADAGAAAVFEDAVSGVAAGRAGGFGFVVGVDRVGHADALRKHGADVVVEDLAELLEGAPS